MVETFNIACDRLCRDGRWQEASRFKDSQLARLLREGMPYADASAAAWQQMVETFPPVVGWEDPDPRGPAPGGTPGEIEELEERLESLTSRDVRMVHWASEHRKDPDMTPARTPSREHWVMLHYAREDDDRFVLDILVRVQKRYSAIRRVNESALGRLTRMHMERLDVRIDTSELIPFQLVVELLDEHPDLQPPLVHRERESLCRLACLASDAPPLKAIDLLLNRADGDTVVEAADLFAERMRRKPLRIFAENLLENFLYKLAQDRPGLLGPRQDLD